MLNLGYRWALHKMIGYQVILILITATFSYFVVTGSCKGTITCLQSKKIRLQSPGVYRTHNPQALRALASLGHHSPKQSISKLLMSVTLLLCYHMAGNIGIELNLVVGEINHALPNFIPPTFNTCIKKILNTYTSNIKVCYLNSTITITCPSTSFTINKGASWPCLRSFVAKCAWLCETKWTEPVINFCVECSLIPTILCSIHNCGQTPYWRGVGFINFHLSDHAPTLFILQ